jgi:iron complex outermembrane receptor protein
LSEKLHLETGLAFNTTRYSCEIFCSSGNNSNLAYTFGVWSPQAGLSYRFTKNKTIYASISKGFRHQQFRNIDSWEINTSLKPEIGWNYELGLKLHGLNNKLYTELTFFSTQITNLLVARRTAEDQYIGINAGEFAYWDGISANYQLLQTSQFKLSSYFRLRSIASHLKTLLMGTIIILEINSLAFPMHNGT